MTAAFRVTQGLYTLALGTWFGATGMLAITAALAFGVLRDADPVLPAGPAGNPQLAEFTADYLAGNVANAAFAALTVIQLVCAAILIAALVLQGALFRHRLVRAGRTWPNALRVAAIALGLALFASDLFLTRGPMGLLREDMYDEQVTAAQHAALRDDFQRLHARSARSQGLAATLMAAAVLLSPFAFTSRPTDSESPRHG